jgi:hypothetical protein
VIASNSFENQEREQSARESNEVYRCSDEDGNQFNRGGECSPASLLEHAPNNIDAWTVCRMSKRERVGKPWDRCILQQMVEYFHKLSSWGPLPGCSWGVSASLAALSLILLEPVLLSIFSTGSKNLFGTCSMV